MLGMAVSSSGHRARLVRGQRREEFIEVRPPIDDGADMALGMK